MKLQSCCSIMVASEIASCTQLLTAAAAMQHLPPSRHCHFQKLETGNENVVAAVYFNNKFWAWPV